MDFLKDIGSKLLGLLPSLLGGAMSGPMGILGAGALVIGLVVLFFVIRKAWMNYKVSQAQKKGNETAATDEAKVISDNEKQAGEDSATIDAAAKEKEKAQNGLWYRPDIH